MTESSTTTFTTDAVHPEIPAGTRIGPYSVEGALGQGGMASVLVVRDTRDGRLCAMKRLRHTGDDASVVRRFRREFRALSRVHHPNVLRVEEWGVHEGRPWFTMERIDGSDLRTIQGALSAAPAEERFERIRNIIVQIARALAHIHDRGLVHRDISPGNIMVRRDGIVKLADFGLVGQGEAELTRAGEILGTLAYTAPEQLDGRGVDGRADLYALGVVLYELLTGRKPLRAHTVSGWIDRHLRERPVSPSALDPVVPARLDRACMRLLEKEPGERFASAWHLLHALGDRQPDDATAGWPPRAVGRTSFRVWLRDTLDDVAAGRPGGTLILVGPSGMGKSRLLDEADRDARRLGLPVSRLHCRPHDRPYGALAELLRRADPSHVPPILRALFDDTPMPTERWPVLDAFRAVVVAMAPCVLLFDGLEDADAATREVIGTLVRLVQDKGAAPVAMVLAGEAEHPAGLSLGLSDDVPALILGPLSLSEVEELVLGVVHDDRAASALAARLHAETGGRPDHLADTLRTLLDEGILRTGPEGVVLTVAPEDLDAATLPLAPSLRASLTERLAPLDADAREVAVTLALASGPLDLDTLIDAVPCDEARAIEALDALDTAGVVIETRRQDTDRIELSHARFRDVLLADQPPAALATRHRRLGEQLEARVAGHSTDALAESLGWHFEQAGEPVRALRYLALAGRRHVARDLSDPAARYLDRALAHADAARAASPGTDVERVILQAFLDRADAHHHLGNWQAAHDDAVAAVTLADQLGDRTARARAHGALGALLRWRALIDEAEPHLRAALEHAQHTDALALRALPTYHLGAIAWMRRDLETAEARWQHARRLARAGADRRSEGLTSVGLGILAFCRGEAQVARTLLEEAADTFSALGMLADLAIARVDLAELNLSTGLLSRALADADRTVAEARAHGQPQGVAMGLMWRARLLRAIGRLAGARRCAEEALDIARRIGAGEEEVGALTTLVAVLLAAGEPDVAHVHVEALRARLACVDHEGALPLAATLAARVHVARGEHQAARDALSAAQADDTPFPHVRVRMALAAGKAHAALGDHVAASRYLHDALDTARQLGFRYYELVAHDCLARLVGTPDAAAHAMRARSLARQVAQGLTREDAAAFRTRAWGGEAI